MIRKKMILLTTGLLGCLTLLGCKNTSNVNTAQDLQADRVNVLQNPYFLSTQITKIFDAVYQHGGIIGMRRRVHLYSDVELEYKIPDLLNAREKYYMSLVGPNCPYLESADCGSIYKLNTKLDENNLNSVLLFQESPGSICNLGPSTDYYPVSGIKPLSNSKWTVQEAADWFFGYKCRTPD